MSSTDNSVLSDSRWLMGLNHWGHPTDLRPSLFYGYANVNPRRFSKIDKSQLIYDDNRITVIAKIADAIRSAPYSESTKAVYADSLKRLIKWADDNMESISRKTIISLLTRCPNRQNISAVMHAAAQSLSLSEHERALLFPPITAHTPAIDPWVLTFSNPYYSHNHDFVRFLFPGDAALDIQKFSRIRAQRLAASTSDSSGRVALIHLLLEEYKSLSVSKSFSEATIGTSFFALRWFLIWADKNNYLIDKQTIVSVLQSYCDYLNGRWRSGANANTTRQKVQSIVPIISSALELDHLQFISKIRVPPKNRSGLQTKRPDPENLQLYCLTLHEIVRALSADVLCDPIYSPILIKVGALQFELPKPFGGYGQPTSDARLSNLILFRLRVWAELHRFIGLTGVNLSVAQEITISQWEQERRHMTIFKSRANKLVQAHISEQYAKHLDHHVAFLRKASTILISGSSPLFPGHYPSQGFGREYAARARSGSLGPLKVAPMNPSRDHTLAAWFRNTGLPTLTTRQLRKAKSDWLLRRYRGDTLRVSRALGNSPQVVHQHYGGSGNLATAMSEWPAFWSSNHNTASIAPGLCTSPGNHSSMSSSPTDDCHNGACLNCRHYRGEDSLDYVHRILSFQDLLRIRAPSNETIPPLVEKIDRIIDSYLANHPDDSKKVSAIRKQLSDYPHPLIAASIQIATILHD